MAAAELQEQYASAPGNWLAQEIRRFQEQSTGLFPTPKPGDEKIRYNTIYGIDYTPLGQVSNTTLMSKINVTLGKANPKFQTSIVGNLQIFEVITRKNQKSQPYIKNKSIGYTIHFLTGYKTLLGIPDKASMEQKQHQKALNKVFNWPGCPKVHI